MRKRLIIKAIQKFIRLRDLDEALGLLNIKESDPMRKLKAYQTKWCNDIAL